MNAFVETAMLVVGFLLIIRLFVTIRPIIC